MNQDYSIQFLKLAAKCFAVVAVLGFVGGAIVTGFVSNDSERYLMPLFLAGAACFYSAIPIALFTGFVIVLRAFGRQP